MKDTTNHCCLVCKGYLAFTSNPSWNPNNGKYLCFKKISHYSRRAGMGFRRWARVCLTNWVKVCVRAHGLLTPQWKGLAIQSFSPSGEVLRLGWSFERVFTLVCWQVPTSNAMCWCLKRKIDRLDQQTNLSIKQKNYVRDGLEQGKVFRMSLWDTESQRLVDSC